MVRYQVLLITVLICSVAFMACERTQDMLEEVMMEPEQEMMGPDEMMAYKSWMSVDLEAPMMTVEEAAAAMNAAGTGQAHGAGVRTVYFNEAAAMANMAEGDKMYPVGSMIVKEVFGVDEMADQVVHVATMTKTDDPMYAERGGWIYGVGGNNLPLEGSTGCDTCHAKAGEGNDYVFVSLMKGDGMDTDMGNTDMDNTDMDNTDMDNTDMGNTDTDDTDNGENGNGNGSV